MPHLLPYFCSGQLVTRGNGPDRIYRSSLRFSRYSRYLNGVGSGEVGNAVGAYLNDAVLARTLPGTVSLYLNNTVLTGNLPGAIRFNLDNIAVGCMIAPTTVRVDFNTAVTGSGANDGV